MSRWHEHGIKLFIWFSEIKKKKNYNNHPHDWKIDVSLIKGLHWQNLPLNMTDVNHWNKGRLKESSPKISDLPRPIKFKRTD